MKRSYFIPALLILLSSNLFSQSIFVDSTFNDRSKVDTTLSFAYANNGKKLILARGENENLAKNKKAYIVYRGAAPLDTSKANGSRLVDGTDGTWIVIDPRSTGKDNSGSYIIIDLLSVRLVNRIVVLQAFGSINPNTKVLAYTIEAGLDTLSMSRMLQQPDNSVPNIDTTFDVIAARFIRFTIDAVARVNYQTIIAEIKVYGTGFLSEASYICKPVTMPAKSNFGLVSWDATTAPQTSINFQFRTGDTLKVDSTWSPWSEEIKVPHSPFGVDEPRKCIQYRINLSTSSLETPILNSFNFYYDTLLVVQKAIATILSKTQPILQKVDIAYKISLDFNPSDYGVDTIRLLTPTPSQIKSVFKDNVEISPRILYGKGEVTLAFSSLLKTKTDILINFSATLYLDKMNFPSEVSSSASPILNPQRVDKLLQGDNYSWTVIGTGISKKLLVYVGTEPNPFSPNGDGINDNTNINFYVANLNTPRTLQVTIFDVTGRKIRSLFNGGSEAGAYVEGNAIVWDGKDDNNKIVRPGVYIYRVQITSDNGGEAVSKTVSVVY